MSFLRETIAREEHELRRRGLIPAAAAAPAGAVLSDAAGELRRQLDAAADAEIVIPFLSAEPRAEREQAVEDFRMAAAELRGLGEHITFTVTRETLTVRRMLEDRHGRR